ncbi:MAG: DUF2339 domain-containing protein [Phycisphaerales bacterium]|nr:DUF2339 domain-containing protein [Phycisphaerales bacterium]
MDHSAAERLERRLNDLETRLARLEGSVPSAAVPVTAPPAPTRVEMAAVEPAPIPVAPVAPPIAPPIRSKNTDRAEPRSLARGAGARAESGASGAWSFERLLGGRAFAALGALGVVIGMGFFVKLAYDEGWLRVSPSMRCLGAAAFGAALLAAGVWTRRRLAPWAVAGLMSAGLGVMYGAGFAAFTLYGLLTPAAALALLAAVSALGAFVGAKTRMSPVALLSIVAAYLAPLVVASEASPPLAMPPYLLAVCAVGLALSRRNGRGFGLARALAGWGLAALGAVWTVTEGDELPWYALAFLGGAAALLIGDAALRAQRLDADRPGEEEVESIAILQRARARLALGAFSALTWATLLGVHVLRESGRAPEWMWSAGMGSAAFIFGLVLAGHLRFGRDPATTARETLGGTLLIASGCAGGYALTLALSGWTEVFAWLGVGVGAVLAGTWARARPLHVYGMAALALGTVGVLIQHSAARGPVVPSMGIEWSRGTWTLLGAAAAWVATARLLLIGAGPAWRSTAQATLGLGAALLAGAFALGEPRAESLALVWAALGAGFASWGLFERRLGVRAAGLALGAAAVGAWSAAALESGWMTSGGTILGLRPLLWWALLIACVTGVIGVWMLRSPRIEGEAETATTHRAIAACGVALGALLTLAATSLESARLTAVWTSDAAARAAAGSLGGGGLGPVTLAVGGGPRDVVKPSCVG